MNHQDVATPAPATTTPRFALALAVVIILETVLGGSGRAISIGPVTLRMVIFGVFVCTFLLPALTLGTIVRPLAWLTCAGIAVWIAVFGTVGVLYGASVGAAISDANAYLTLTYLILFTYLLRTSPRLLNTLTRTIEIGALSVATFTIAVLIASYLGWIHLAQLDDALKSLGYGGNTGGITGGTPRIYFISQIFLQMALGLVVARLLLTPRPARKGSLADLLRLGWLCAALVITYTRGFWIGAFITVVAIVFAARSWRVVARISLTLLPLAAGLAFIVTLGAYRQGNLEKRLLSSGDFTQDQGNVVRALEVVEVAQQLRGHTLVGVGFGTPLPNSYYRLRERITGKQLTGSEFVIELSYLDLLRQVGILGMVAFLTLLGAVLFRIRSTLRHLRVRGDPQTFGAAAGFSAGFLGFLVTAATNPYLLSSAGMIFLSLAASIALALSASSSKPLHGRQLDRVKTMPSMPTQS